MQSLREARLARFWTQEKASEYAQVSRITYVRWELGQAHPRLYNLGLLCQAFQMSPEELGFPLQPYNQQGRQPERSL